MSSTCNVLALANKAGCNWPSIFQGGFMRTVFLACAIMFGVTSAYAASDVAVTEKMAFPESLTSTQDGTLYIGGMNLGVVSRAAPGQGTATTFISRQAGGFGRVLGVLA